VAKKYDWGNLEIPECIKWIATNENGEVFGFTNKPILNNCSLGWESTNKNHNPMRINLKPHEGGWEESLEQRTII